MRASERELHQEPLICIVTGERGAGKSTVCARVAREAVQQGFTVAGLLTERTGSAEPGAARRVVDLRTGEDRAFSSRDTTAGGVDTSDPLTPGWKFESGIFAWANEALVCSVPCDLLIVDEVGPLELLGGRGWAKALEVLCSPGYRAALVVCRPALLYELDQFLGPRRTVVVEVTPEMRDLIPTAIMERLRSADSDIPFIVLDGDDGTRPPG